MAQSRVVSHPPQEPQGDSSIKGRDPPTLRPPSLDSIMLIGTSFKTSSLDFRERLVRILRKRQRELPGWTLAGREEQVILETCNRIEFYLTSVDPARTVLDFFSNFFGTTREQEEEERDGFYFLKGKDVISHLFNLASGLESMVPGEDQILSQVRRAGTRAKVEGSSRGVLSMVFDEASSVGSRMRNAGVVRSRHRSVGEFALSLALSKLRKPGRALIVGTGETAKLAAERLSDWDVYVATRRKGVASSQFADAKLISYLEIRSTARGCDMVISASRARESEEGYVLRLGDLSDDRQLVLLDLSFPRTIDPAFKDCRHITLYDLDDLAAKVGAAASESARSLVEDEVSRFTKRLIATRFSPSLANLYVWAEELRNSEVQTALRRLTRLSDREKQVVDVLSRRLVSKLLAPAAVFASGSSESFPQQDRLRALLEIFVATRKSPIGQTDHRHAV